MLVLGHGSLLGVVKRPRRVIWTLLLVLVMLISGSEKVMGKFKNGLLASSIGWITVALMASAAVAMLLTGGS